MVITSPYFLKRVSHRDIPVISIEQKLFRTCNFCIMPRAISSQRRYDRCVWLIKVCKYCAPHVQELHISIQQCRRVRLRRPKIYSEFGKRTQGGKGDPAGGG